ncbi:Acyl-CoA:1-acyl-sn-glycerol-3-phosphate acyltransferase (EC [Olavius algarvensis Delta 1 endosymbiont]|nr:Acyl-CoA:1-acyl-sn-glycerol-3-phosphate acyltransferase (EC [Olavius algarvensis Delta 1 endosymbiont]
MIRTTYIFIWVVLSTIFWGLAAIFTSFFTRTGNPVHKVARIWARGILFVSRIKVTINGLANIDPTQSYVYMSNHQSNFDIPVLLAHLPVQFRWLAKAELFKIPIFGRAMRGAGYVKIDRFNQQSAFESISEAAGKMKNGVSVMIFPEGTRSRDGKIKNFKKGGFIMAVDAGVPIVPLVLKGTWSIMDKSSMRINKGEVSLNIGAPIATADYTRENKDDLMQSVRAIICEEFEKG